MCIYIFIYICTCDVAIEFPSGIIPSHKIEASDLSRIGRKSAEDASRQSQCINYIHIYMIRWGLQIYVLGVFQPYLGPDCLNLQRKIWLGCVKPTPADRWFGGPKP